MDAELTDKDIQPTDEVLKALLKKSFTYFKKIRELSGSSIQEWKYYDKKNGWVFKVSNKKRGLYYISPLAGSFQAGLTVNEVDKNAVLNSAVNGTLKTELAEAKKYMEGYPIRVLIQTKKDFDQFVLILKTINRI